MIFDRLRENKGESLAETLVSILIMALGIMLLAGMIQSSSNVIVRSEKAIKEYTEEENMMIQHDSRIRKDGNYLVKISTSPGSRAIRFNKDDEVDVEAEFYEIEYANTKIVAFGVK